MKKIISFKVERTPDYDADLSFLGTFSNEAKSELAIEHKPNDSRSFNWFNPEPGTCETLEHAKQQYDRLIAYEDGQWGMVSVCAIAQIQTSDDGKTWLCNTIKSGGLYGVEDDMADADYKDIETEEAEQLISALKSLGFTREEIEEAQHKD